MNEAAWEWAKAQIEKSEFAGLVEDLNEGHYDDAFDEYVFFTDRNETVVFVDTDGEVYSA